MSGRSHLAKTDFRSENRVVGLAAFTCSCTWSQVPEERVRTIIVEYMFVMR